jgi:hypothetical protein
LGGEYHHIGTLSHDRPLDGLHPAVGGNATPSESSFAAGDAWPAVTLTQESRASLFLGSDSNLVDLIYRDPDSQDVTLRILSDQNGNLFDGFDNEIFATTLNAGQNDWVLLENLDLPGLNDEPQWLHFELSDGGLTSHATFPMNGAAVPEPSSVILLMLATAIFGQFRTRQ